MRFRTDFRGIVISGETITVEDNARRAWQLALALGLVLVARGSAHLFGWAISDEAVPSYLYVFVFFAGLFLVIYQSRFSTQSSIEFEEIREIKHIKRFGNQWIDVKLESKIRRIHGTKAFSQKLIEYMDKLQ